MALVNGDNEFDVDNKRLISLQRPAISDMINILTIRLRHYFKDVEIKYTECPNLTAAPYNLAAKGLCGEEIIVGCIPTGIDQQNVALWDLRETMELCSDQTNEVFLIGGGYTRTPVHPFNGILIMNATHSAPIHYNNESCVVFKDTNSNRIRMETLRRPEHMICSMGGNFFISEGKEGRVINIRVKGRKYDPTLQNTDIKNLIRIFLSDLNPTYNIGLGGILMVKRGGVTHKVLPNIPEIKQIITPDYLDEFYENINSQVNGKPFLISLGTIASTPIANSSLLKDLRHNFYTFSNINENGGLFFNDTSDTEIEYVGYFNTALATFLPQSI